MRHVYSRNNVPFIESRQLSRDDVPAILDMQQHLSKRIIVTDRSHIPSFRSEKELISHLDAGMMIAGLLDGKNVIGFCLLTYPDNEKAQYVENYSLSNPQNTVLLQTFLLDPSYLQFDTFTKLYDVAIALAQKTGRETLTINTAKTNKRVLSGIKNMGFEKTGEGHNFKDVPVCFFNKDLKP